MLLHTLIEAGCHLGPDDLTVAEWFAVADLKRALERQAADAVQRQRDSVASGPPTIHQITLPRP